MRRNNSIGIFTLALLGGYFVWRNRYQLQDFFKARGFEGERIGENLKERLQSAGEQISEQARKAV